MSTASSPSTPPRLWSDEDRHKVMLMLQRGYTCSNVAKVMKLTRNAAVGRIYRDSELFTFVNRHKAKPKKSIIPKLKFRALPVEPVEPVVAATVGEPAPGCVMLLFDTGRYWCKWPVASHQDVIGGILCCGAPTQGVDVYCPYHRSLARPQ